MLAVLSFNLSSVGGGLDDTQYLDVEASRDGLAFTLLARFMNDITGTGLRSFDLTPFISSTTTIRITATGTFPANNYYQIDNVNIITGAQASATKDNIPGGGNDLIDGVPSSITLPADSFALAPGETLTGTFHVTVNDPQALTRIVNTVLASAFESPQRVHATVIDPISPGGQVGDRVWLDVDRDGVQDVGEPGISGVTVECATASAPRE